jgi:hypothetical protein
MAIVKINYFSKELKAVTEINIVTPFDAPEEEYPNKPDFYKPFYLLHGYSSNHHDWLVQTTLPSLAVQYGYVFILPSGGKSFYLNNMTSEE